MKRRSLYLIMTNYNINGIIIHYRKKNDPQNIESLTLNFAIFQSFDDMEHYVSSLNKRFPDYSFTWDVTTLVDGLEQFEKELRFQMKEQDREYKAYLKDRQDWNRRSENTKPSLINSPLLSLHSLTFDDEKQKLIDKSKGENKYLGDDVDDIGEKGFSHIKEVEDTLNQIEIDRQKGVDDITIERRTRFFYFIIAKSTKGELKQIDKKIEAIELVNKYRRGKYTIRKDGTTYYWKIKENPKEYIMKVIGSDKPHSHIILKGGKIISKSFEITTNED